MREISTSGSPFEAFIEFSRACRIGSHISVSGTAPLDMHGNTVHEGNAYLQTKRCLEISLKAISELGGTVDGVIRTRIMLKDISDWEQAAKAHGEVFSSIKPACTFVEVTGFINPSWLVETEMDCIV